MKDLRTVRGQSARIVKEGNEKYTIELYSNGEWGKPASCYNCEFQTEAEAIRYFESKREFIHQ